MDGTFCRTLLGLGGRGQDFGFYSKVSEKLLKEFVSG